MKDLKPFTANGHRYSFNLDLPISRFKEFQKLKLLIQFGGKDEADLFDESALFVNREGENPNTYDPALNALKIEDWAAEGLKVSDFFGLAAALMKRFTESLQNSVAEAAKANPNFMKKKKRSSKGATTRA